MLRHRSRDHLLNGACVAPRNREQFIKMHYFGRFKVVQGHQCWYAW